MTGKTVSPAHDDEGIRLLKAVKDAIADSTNDLLVLELGSGTGSLSVYLHSMLRFTATPASQRNVQIVATDLGKSAAAASHQERPLLTVQCDSCDVLG